MHNNRHHGPHFDLPKALFLLWIILMSLPYHQLYKIDVEFYYSHDKACIISTLKKCTPSPHILRRRIFGHYVMLYGFIWLNSSNQAKLIDESHKTVYTNKMYTSKSFTAYISLDKHRCVVYIVWIFLCFFFMFYITFPFVCIHYMHWEGLVKWSHS